MGKSLAWFEKHCALNSREPLQAFLRGAQRQGFEVRADDMSADVAVIWSILWNGRMAPNREIYQHFRSQGKPVIVMDVGALQRNRTWKLAVNHVTAEGGYGHQQDLDPDRPAKLGLKLINYPAVNDAILIAGQHARSMAMQPWPSQEDWINDAIRLVRKHSDRPIVVRPHPRSPISPQRIVDSVTLQRPRPVANTYDSFDMNLAYHAAVNHNSGPGIQAAMAGVRPVVNLTSLAYPVGVGFAQIEQSYDLDRQQWLTQISHTEYFVSELEQGIWYPRINQYLHG